LLAQAAAAPHLYFDGYICYRKMNGVLRCIAHTTESRSTHHHFSAGRDPTNRDTRKALDPNPSGRMGWQVAHSLSVFRLRLRAVDVGLLPF